MTARYPILVLISAFVVACSSTGSKQDMGAMIGGSIGAIAGATMGKGSNRAASILIGTAVGAMVGYGIGQLLNDQDKKQMATSTMQTAESGQVQQVSNPNTGTTIRTEPVPSTPATASNCRTVKQSVELPDGRNESENVTVCKGPNGWEAA